MSNVFLCIIAALQITQIVLRQIELRRMRETVSALHARGMHDAATLVRCALLPNDLPSAEQVNMMRRDGWPIR